MQFFLSFTWSCFCQFRCGQSFTRKFFLYAFINVADWCCAVKFCSPSPIITVRNRWFSAVLSAFAQQTHSMLSNDCWMGDLDMSIACTIIWNECTRYLPTATPWPYSIWTPNQTQSLIWAFQPITSHAPTNAFWIATQQSRHHLEVKQVRLPSIFCVNSRPWKQSQDVLNVMEQ